MKNLLWRLGWSRWWSPNSFKASAAEIELALVEIEQKLHFCARKEALHRAEEAAAYLLKGAVDAARASKLKPSSGDYIQANRSALRHFIRALEIDPNDPEALEYVAHQHRALQEIDLALTHYERLVNISSGSSIEGRILRSRAHRYAGEMLERKFNGSGIQANLSRARDHLDLKDGALDCLPDDCRWTLDHAAIHEVAGRVTEKQGAAQLPGTHYGQALAIYEDILRREPKNMDAKDGRERMIKALADFHADAGAPPNPAPHMLQ